MDSGPPERLRPTLQLKIKANSCSNFDKIQRSIITLAVLIYLLEKQSKRM